MKKAVFFILLLLAMLVFASQLDDKLDPEVIRLVNKANTAAESDAYLYLLGITANESEDPAEVGRRLFEQYQIHENDSTHEIIEYPESKKLPLPNGELFCMSSKEGCLERLFAATYDELKAPLSKHAVLLARRGTLHSLGDFATLAKPDIAERIPEHNYMARAEMLVSLSAIYAYKQGDTEGAVKTLLSQLSELRSSLEQQDTLIGRMIYIALLSHTLDLLTIIASKAQVEIVKIPGLNESEKSLSVAFAREFAMAYYLYTALDRHPEIFETGGDLPSWIARAFYKPNMTINAAVQPFMRFIHLDSLSPSAFAAEVEASHENTESLSAKIRNPTGTILHRIAMPNFGTYSAKVIDLDTKIMLLNHLTEGFAHIKNPYYPNEGLEVNDGKVCFRGPFEREQFQQCIRTKI